jgi:hypothetical protein
VSGLRSGIRDKDSNLDLHVQSVASSRLDHPGLQTSDMFSMPLAYPSTLDRGYRVLRGGALEPGARIASDKSQAKATANSAASFSALGGAGGPFSLRRGLDSDQSLFKLSITFVFRSICLKTKKATLLGRPRFELLCG